MMSLPMLEFQPFLLVLMTIVLLVMQEKSVQFADLEKFHKEENVSEDVDLDISKTEKDVQDVKEVVLDAETEEIAKNVLEEKS